MEDYLAELNRLRSYVNDVEAAAAKRSAEEQMQRTAIEALQNDVHLVSSETKQLNAEAEEMVKAKNKVGLETVEKYHKMSSLEIECSTLKQTLELLHQEISSTSRTLADKKLSFTKVLNDLDIKLQKQQEWLYSYKQKKLATEQSIVVSPGKQNYIEGAAGSVFAMAGSSEEMMSGKQNDLSIRLESGKRKIEVLEAKKSALFYDSCKNKELLKQENQIINGFPTALQEMGFGAFEEEQKALLSDKAGEKDYIQSLQGRINGLKEVSDSVKCGCGLEYNVEFTGETEVG